MKEASEEGDLFAFVPEFYINILPILLDTIMDFSFHDLNMQNDLSGKLKTCTHLRWLKKVIFKPFSCRLFTNNNVSG